METVFTDYENEQEAQVVRKPVEEIHCKRFYISELERIMLDEADTVIGWAMFSRFHLERNFGNELLLLSMAAVKTELRRQHSSET